MKTAPWTEEQVEALNLYQKQGQFHPFTCGGDRLDQAHIDHAYRAGTEPGLLVATTAGWVCPCCDYTQDWAHDFMFGPAT